MVAERFTSRMWGLSGQWPNGTAACLQTADAPASMFLLSELAEVLLTRVNENVAVWEFLPVHCSQGTRCEPDHHELFLLQDVSARCTQWCSLQLTLTLHTASDFHKSGGLLASFVDLTQLKTNLLSIHCCVTVCCTQQQHVYR
jgi:hypothetical protein